MLANSLGIIKRGNNNNLDLPSKPYNKRKIKY